MSKTFRQTAAALLAVFVIGCFAQCLAKDDFIQLHPKGQRLAANLQGPYANLPDGSVLAVDSQEAMVSGDDEPWPKARKIVALGSSTTARRGSVQHVYCDRLDTMLRDRGLPVAIVNSGVGGSTTEHSRERFQRDVLDHHPELVTIMLGGNDSAIDVWKSPPATGPRVAKQRYAENLRYFVKTLKDAKVKVILMAPPPFRWTDKLKELYGKPPYDVNDPWGFSAGIAEYREVVRTVAQKENVPLVDVFAAFREYDSADGQSVDDLLLDGMHSNDKGHALIAELLAPAIEKVFK